METCVESAVSWFQWHPPVGVFIAILALLGVLVPLFREWGTIKQLEKSAWTIAMLALLSLELRTLYLDRDEHDREQALSNCRQLEHFGAIAQRIETTINTSKQVNSKLDVINDFIRKPYPQSAYIDQRQRRSADIDRKLETIRDRASGDQIKYLRTLSLQINNALRSLLARSGFASKLTFDAKANIATLANHKYVNQTLGNEATQWFDSEAYLINSGDDNSQRLQTAVTEGTKIFRGIEAVPMAEQIVIDADIPLYSDIEGKHRLPGVGVKLDERMPEGTHNNRIFPTSKIGYFKKDMSVSWEWSSTSFVWPQAYYLDHVSGTMKSAFVQSMGFEGRNMQELLVKE